ncbi:MAG: hypothetical protein NUV81_01615 [bacterium]|nr:hypothetical protein [bacterium]
MNHFSILSGEKIASIRDIQKNPSQNLKGITRVTRGGSTIGFFLSTEDFEDLVESHEALSNPAFIRSVSKGRQEIKSGKGVSLESLVKKYDI